MNKPKILVVDDESSVLRALRRGLRQKARNWDAVMEESPIAALALLDSVQPLVVVSEKRMSEMDGADFLKQVKERLPLAVRVVISGYTARQVVAETLDVAHLMLAKPFEVEDLVSILDAAYCLNRLPIPLELRERIGCMKTLPVLPQVYEQLVSYLDSTEEPDAAKIAEIIGHDMAILSKILQLANSAFFGFASAATNAQDAVVRLGVEMVKSLVLYYGLFENKDGDNGRHAKIEAQAEEVAGLMRSLMTALGLKRHVMDYGFIIGLLHNIGELVTQGESVDQELSATASAYLLKLWGFDEEMVRAVLYHTDPSKLAERSLLCLCLHVACACSHYRQAGDFALEDVPGLNIPALEDAGVIGRVELWFQQVSSACC